MIVVDTSALMAILLNEPEADECHAALEGADDLVISAGTVAEALLVSARRGVEDEMTRMIDGIGFEVVSVDLAAARRVARAHARWGRGRHPAALNFGDCFAYATAAQRRCRLLYVGRDFAQTDIERALSPG